jgi:hypothetical protein
MLVVYPTTTGDLMMTTFHGGSSRATVVLVLGALLLLPCAALAAKPKPGHYTGTTVQGHALVFDVEKKGKKKRKARNLEYTVEAPCDYGGTAEAGGVFPSSEKVSKKGKFSFARFDQGTIEVKGKFTSQTRAKGTLQYTVAYAVGGIVVGVCDSAVVDWGAQRG